MKKDILIIGGGLSGLHTAYALHQRGVECVLIEARDRLGGRILSRRGADPEGPAFDLGPTWFWPGQHRIEALVRTLGLGPRVFDQPSDGDALYENEAGAVLRGLGGVSMAGSYRLEGGLIEIITALAGRIPEENVWYRSRVTQITRHGDRLQTTVQRDGRAGNGETIAEFIDSERVVIALPPRIAASSIAWSPALPATHRDALRQTPTWMAGHAKLVALYDEPFWRSDGLSGDAISTIGPLSEIHDASPPTGGPAALFGFVGVPPGVRAGRESDLQGAAVAQLERLFGQHASRPRDVLLKDWAFDPLTATDDDHAAQLSHPIAGSGGAAEMTWDHRLLWSGSETANEGMRNNGYLEGALEASERTVRQLVDSEQVTGAK